MIEWLFSWLGRLVVRYWITAGLFFLLASVVTYTLQEARWVRDPSSLTIPFITSLIVGWLLAKSRFRSGFAVFYSIFIAAAVSVQAIGGFLPGLRTILTGSARQMVNEMNFRVLELSLRVSGWVSTLSAGENIQDTGLFVAFMAAILVLCGIWLVWAMQRQKRVINGLLPIGMFLAVNIHLSHQPLVNFMVFLFTALLLIARTSFNRQKMDWEQRRVDFPEQIGLEWGSAAVLLTVVIVLAARLAPLFGTAEGWQILSDWVERTREQTSDTATRLFSGVHPPPPPAGQKKEIYANTPNLEEIGLPIPQGYETIMWVSISDPAPVPQNVSSDIPAAVTRIHYWRSGVYSTYTGRGWKQAPMSGIIELQRGELPENPPPGRYYLRQNFQVEAKHGKNLFSTNDPVKTSERVYLRQVPPDGSRLLEGQAVDYQVISAATRVSANELAAAPADYPAEIRSLYLQLPDSLPDRVRSLASRMVQGDADPYHKAVRIQNYLRDHYEYDLRAQPAPANRDVVDYFLFDAPRGFCSQYASAMVVMLRAVGVPARIASGYAMGEYDYDRAAFRVPVSAAHAWVEVFFPGYGWVEFEPTTERAAIDYPEDGPEAAAPIVLITPEIEADQPVSPPTMTGLVIAAALLLLALPFLVMRMFITARQAPAVQVDALYRNMRRALGWAGLSAVPSVTPDEYLALFGPRLQPYAQLSRALTQVTQLYRETIFSPRPPEEHRVRFASQLWQQSVQEWLSLWLKTRWQKARARITNPS